MSYWRERKDFKSSVMLCKGCVRSCVMLEWRWLSSSPLHGPLCLTAGGHSSILSLWHAVNLPERALHSARKLNTTYLSIFNRIPSFCSTEVTRAHSHGLPCKYPGWCFMYPGGTAPWIEVRWRSNCEKVLMGQGELQASGSLPASLRNA